MAHSSGNEVKPYISFSEKNSSIELVLVIDGLEVKGLFKKEPKNGNIINQIINEQSINYAIEINSLRKVYRLNIKRLPSQINPDKTKIKYEKDKVIITLNKRNNDTWLTHKDTDFETIHLVKG